MRSTRKTSRSPRRPRREVPQPQPSPLKNYLVNGLVITNRQEAIEYQRESRN